MGSISGDEEHHLTKPETFRPNCKISRIETTYSNCFTCIYREKDKNDGWGGEFIITNLILNY